MRKTAVLTAGTLLALVIPALAAAPAAAADPAADLAVFAGFVSVSAGDTPLSTALGGVTNNGPATATAVVATIDVSQLTATVTFAPSCTVVAKVATCPLGDLNAGDQATIDVEVSAPVDAEVGFGGTYTITASSSTEDSDTGNNLAEGQVNIADPTFDLDVIAADVNDDAHRAGPGAVLPLFAAVANIGAAAAPDLFIQIQAPTGTTFVEHFPDCVYSETLGTGAPGTIYGPGLVTCEGGPTLDPGVVLFLFDPTTGESIFHLRTGTNMPGPQEETGMVAAGAGDDPHPIQAAKARTGGPATFAAALAALRARTKGLTRAQARATLQDAHDFDNAADYSLFTAPNTIDLKITGPASLTGRQGDTVTLSAVTENLGPSDGGGPRYHAIAPTGTTFVFVPGGRPFCHPDDPGYSGQPWTEAPRLVCFYDSELPRTKPGGPVNVLHDTFKLKILDDQVGDDGSITIENIGPSTEKNRANNVLRIVITAPGAPLPVTGARTGVIAGLGAAVMVTGAGLLWLLARRRRSREAASF